MKIARSDRVRYANNPLAEVVCQLRFDRLPDWESREPVEFQNSLSSSSYPERSIEQSFALTLHTSGPVNVPVLPPQPGKLYHFATADSTTKVTLCSDFVALTTTKYESWEDFLPRLLEVIAILASCYPNAVPKRLGLRYKDLIERENLNLAGVPWHELVKPFLLGPLAPNALVDEFAPDDGDVGNMLSQSILRLDDCMLLLQSSMLWSIDRQRRAFLIDADFFTEDAICADMVRDSAVIRDTLEKLHNNAGALFRRCITGRLHDALSPQPK
ncbi:TIGR04255 family protein [Burkholderia sp. EMB26]|uniref:TIGR04255 family protein n=1 Tax=Burkholderia sp. EMB26 TaxID=2854261 RepID=UPI00215A7955|nr:TIGR04255 family protein [Burkholderia sp. EMB26]UVE54302.1 TIGR04255 family protein [Burkholderia sp. EMB26]